MMSSIADSCVPRASRRATDFRLALSSRVVKRLAEIGTKRENRSGGTKRENRSRAREARRRAKHGAISGGEQARRTPELPPSRDRAAGRICISIPNFPTCGAEQVSKQVREQAIRFALEQHESSRSHQQPHMENFFGLRPMQLACFYTIDQTCVFQHTSL